MRTIFVRFYNPNDVMDFTPETTDEEIKEYCFKVNKYASEQLALMAYAETPGTQWSTILDDDTDIEKWIDDTYEHIKNHDTDWLEENFV